MSLTYDPMGLVDYCQVIDINITLGLIKYDWFLPLVCKREEWKMLRNAQEALGELQDLKSSLEERPNQALDTIEDFKKDHATAIHILKHQNSIYLGQIVPTLFVRGPGYFRNKKALLLLNILSLTSIISGPRRFSEQANAIYTLSFLIFLTTSLLMYHKGSPQLSDYWKDSKAIKAMQSELKAAHKDLLNSVRTDTPEHHLLCNTFACSKSS